MHHTPPADHPPASPRTPQHRFSAVGATVLVDDDQCRRTIARIAHEIVEHHPDPSTVALVGLHTRGVPLAERLRALIEEFSGARPAIGSVDIALYRDDVGVGGGRRGVVPVVGETILDFDILIDDRPETLMALPAELVIVYDRPWNRDVTGRVRAHRFSDLPAAVAMLLEGR